MTAPSVGPRVGCLLALLLAPAPAGAELPELFRHIPPDSKVVLTVDVTALAAKVDRETLRDYGHTLYAGRLVPGHKKGTASAVSGLTHVVVAAPYLGRSEGVIVLRGKVDATLLEAQCRACKEVTVHEPTTDQPGTIFQRKLPRVKGPAPSTMLPVVPWLKEPREYFFAAVDPSTLLVSTRGKRVLVRALQDRKAGRPAALPEGLGRLLRGQDSGAGLALVVMGNSVAPELRAGPLQLLVNLSRQLKHVTATIHADKKVALVVVATGRDVRAAREIAANLERTLAQARALFPLLAPGPGQAALKALGESFRVLRKGNVVTFTAGVSAEQAEALFSLLAPPPK